MTSGMHRDAVVLGRERAGLLLFGVLEIFLGLFLGISAIVLAAIGHGGAAALGVDALAGPSALPAEGLTVMALLYVGLAALFVTLGMGSLLPRRWVRPLVLYVSTLWLLAGLLLAILIAALVLGMGAADLPMADAESPVGILGSPVVLLLLCGLSFVLYVVLPAALLWFHRRPALKSALERLDPVPRWTDRCPGPVLSLTLSLAISALFCLPFVRGPLPVFGWTLTGPAAAAVTLLTAGGLTILAVATHRLSPLGWWGSVAAVVVLTLVSVDQSFRFDLSSVGNMLGLEPGVTTSDLPSRASGSAGWLLGAGSLLLGAVCLVALLRLRRYFFPSSDPRRG